MHYRDRWEKCFPKCLFDHIRFYGLCHKTQLLQPLDLACGTLFRSSCAIQTSPTDCSDDSWRDTYFGKHEHGALWLLICSALEKHLLTYLLLWPWSLPFSSQNLISSSLSPTSTKLEIWWNSHKRFVRYRANKNFSMWSCMYADAQPQKWDASVLKPKAKNRPVKISVKTIELKKT